MSQVLLLRMPATCQQLCVDIQPIRSTTDSALTLPHDLTPDPIHKQLNKYITVILKKKKTSWEMGLFPIVN